ncbi:esterase-like activity of phytase family protein [Notoacmeibacter sp. MSK16QG-6]|uniref:esterase-like activity of phytase family protein n=1 Tax=Notoacmeibacter sp. MSK16QG-6 TaxID=2957982 RepID=UPI0020A107D7|nr:esterase-like activity of phytase family protein [Notoacmeibacter sp. MSK16QG-6]MCP1199232.1 esterase-like activity of phytase family protein [Notoacmeibacter sp. MSK16QG-6]
MTIRVLSSVSLVALAAAFTHPASAEQVFNRIASFPVNTNLGADEDQATETSAEIIAASEDGNMLVYTDSPAERVGFVDITDPKRPQAAGFVATDGEPTSIAVSGMTGFAGVNTSESFTAPSGYLAVIDIAAKSLTKSCDLGGQPDSVAISKDGRRLAIAIENERDEDLNDGVIPQMPAGYVAIVPLTDGQPDCEAMIKADVTGLAEIAGDDPEPEFVDFNEAGEIAVTLQENNHIVILNGETGDVINHFSAGTVDLDKIDTKEDDAISFDSSAEDVRREPDAVQWIDNDRLATANEGDYKGGSRGFTIFTKAGDVVQESGPSFEYEVARAGHYPEGRSENKGAEPEGMEVATFGDSNYMFLLSERGSVIGVYGIDGDGQAVFKQLLPSGLAPEGAIAIASRNLLAVSNEADLIEDGGVRSHVTLYEFAEGETTYPQIVSDDDENGTPIAWGALSGLAADPADPAKLYAVNDSFYAGAPSIFTIDASQTPARITKAIAVTMDGEPAKMLDLEGIATDGDGGFWLASEGRTDKEIPHRLLHVDASGAVVEEVVLPDALLAHEKRFGMEGVTKLDDTLYIAIQREWGDDPDGMVKILAYDLAGKSWSAAHYPLESAETGWVGLSEITAHGDNLYIIERDNQIGEAAKIKRLYRVSLAGVEMAELGSELPVLKKEMVHDFMDDLKEGNGYVVDKIEGFAIGGDERGWAVTDNDGVDDSNGETRFFTIGEIAVSTN